ncbi:MAG: AMP-binding protein, partial [Bacteroidales bacterium]|nr:AMP-binding protein [Bacteroidales bacterium]
MDDESFSDIKLPDIEAEGIEVPLHVAKFDLTLAYREHQGNCTVSLTYNTALFKHATVERLLDHFHALLTVMMRDLDANIGTLPILQEKEREQILNEFNQTNSDYPWQGCWPTVFEQQVEDTPDLPAIIFREQQYSYKELNQRSNQLAHYLREKGVGPESYVGLYLERCCELEIALIGVLKSGGAYVPLDPEYPQARLGEILDQIEAKVILTTQALSKNLPSEITILCLDEWSTLSSYPTENPSWTIHPHDLAYTIFTSGSTGTPKGVMVEHESLINQMRWMQSTYPAGPHYRVMQKTPFTFDVSLMEFFWPLITGATLVFAEPGGHRDPDYL